MIATTTPIPVALTALLAARPDDSEGDRLARKECHDVIIHCWGLRPQAQLVLDLLGQSPEPEFERLVQSFEAIGGLQTFRSLNVRAEDL